MSEKKSFFTKEVTRQGRSGEYTETEVNVGNIVKLTVGIVAAIIFLIVAWPLRTIGATERGVLKTFGEVQEVVLEPGLKFRVPIAQTIETYDLTPTTVNVRIPVGDDGALSRDRQTIGIGGFYAWRYDETRILDIARNFSSISRLTDQVTREINSAIRQVVGRYDIANIVPEQEKISAEAREQAQRQLINARIPVEITQLQLNNWDWSEGYDQMIQRTVEMQQSAQRAEAELRMIEQEAQQARIRAEAQAQAVEAEARGRLAAAELDAEAVRVAAQARNEANRLIAQNLNVEIQLRNLTIAQTEAERWDGRRVTEYLPLTAAGGIVNVPNSGNR